MYLVQIEVKNSPIQGKGVFTLQKITTGEVVWKFDPTHDKVLSVEEFKKLDKTTQTNLKRVAYLSVSSDRYVYPPGDDPAKFTNHDDKCNNLSALINKNISEEPYFIANKDIEIGEELTNNYSEFDESLKQNKPEWI